MSCSNSWFRKERGGGFTLIEVVAALALLGSLLAGVTLARARYTRQRAVAEKRLEAVATADSLLSQWWQESPDAIPKEGAGTVPGVFGRTRFAWRTGPMTAATPDQQDLVVVRLELRDTQTPGQSQALAAVELVVADRSVQLSREAPVPDASGPTVDDPPLAEEPD